MEVYPSPQVTFAVDYLASSHSDPPQDGAIYCQTICAF